MRELETERIRLEPLRADHAHAMFEGLSNRHLYEFIAEKPPASVEALGERYARLESRRSPSGHEQWLNWVIVTKAHPLARGYVQATVSGTTASIAYVLFETAWGQGLACEAVGAMLVHLYDAYALRTAVATVDPRNQRSIRLLVRLGFDLSEPRKGAEYVEGVLVDEAEYVLQLQR